MNERIKQAREVSARLRQVWDAQAADTIDALIAELGKVYRQQAEDLDEASEAMEYAAEERDKLTAELATLELYDKPEQQEPRKLKEKNHFLRE